MAKIIRIETCVDCDHYSHAAYDDPDYCRKVEKDLLAGGVIPSWCPLEDAPEPIKSVDEYHRKMKGIEMFPEDGVRCRINFYSTPEDEG